MLALKKKKKKCGISYVPFLQRENEWAMRREKNVPKALIKRKEKELIKLIIGKAELNILALIHIVYNITMHNKVDRHLWHFGNHEMVKSL